MKNMKYKLNSWVVTLAVVIAVVLINIIITNLSNKLPIKIDLTKGKQFEITQETKTAVSKIDKEIAVSILGSEDSISPVIKEYVARYKNMSDKIKFTYIDVYKNQGVLQKYQAKGEELAHGDMLFEANGRYKIVKAAQLYSQSPSFEEGQDNYSFELESKMTNAIVTVLGLMEESVVYYLEGHGEQQGQFFPSVIKNQGHKTSTISIVNQDIPTDAKLLITFIPTADFSQGECEKIDKFLESGGNFLAVYSPGIGKLEKLDKYLEEWGIVAGQNIVYEKEKSMIGQNEAMFFPKMQAHNITDNLIAQKLPLMFLGSVSFDTISANIQKATVTPIITTSDKAISKKNLKTESTEFEEGDSKGPFNLAVVSEKTYPNTARVMVIGSAYSVELPEELTGNKANSEFAANTISFLTNNKSNLSIAPKIVTQGKITGLTQLGIALMYYGLVWLVPLIILIIGIVIWLRRRYL
jgi:hypothetical protein